MCDNEHDANLKEAHMLICSKPTFLSYGMTFICRTHLT